jgi:hypothetical protein
LLCLDRTIAQPAEAVEADGAGEGVARFALKRVRGDKSMVDRWTC